MKRERKLQFSPKVRRVIQDYNAGMEEAFKGEGHGLDKMTKALQVMDSALAKLRKLRRRSW